MMKFRAAIIAVTLAAMFFIPISAIPKTEEEIPTADSPEETKESEVPFEEPENAEENFFRIYDIEKEKVENVSFSDYVKGAIASEMGADFEPEALVAQGIAALSCALYQKEANFNSDYDFSAAPGQKLGYITEEKAKEIYGKDFEEKWKIIETAAKKAMEYLVVYEEKPALTVYHAISCGMTESSENAWGGAIPYLVPVKSPGDALSPDFKTETVFSKKEVLEILNKSGAGLSGEYPEQWFEGAVLTESGYVDHIRIGAATFSGERLRNIFGLRSSAFSVEYKKEEFIFSVFGYGHGVGLSQVGANHMAKEGSDFEKILSHYYPGTKLMDFDEYIKQSEQ